MKPMTRSQTILLAVVALLVVLVGLDRAGAFAKGAQEGSLRAAYADKAALVARQEALVADKDLWGGVALRAEAEWRDASMRILHARSRDLAEEDLYERVGAEIRALGSSVNGWRAVEPAQRDEDGEGSRVQRVEVSVDFETASTDALFALVDKLENMQDLWARVVSVEIDGPGAMDLEDARLDVTVRVSAIASIAEGRLTDAR